MRNHLLIGAAVAALAFPAAAHAQSTGSVDFEDEGEIVITGTATPSGVAGVVLPETSKAKAVLTDEFIQRGAPGQTINDTINALPGVSFQNNDPYGSSGGTLTIRGFDSTRISQTFDGVPLNDSGNYALYSNQQLDPELIQQVNVNLGSTDVDSPTAAATGSTVNYRTRVPGEDFGVKLVGSAGDFDFMRIFGMVDTGSLTASGTRAFVSASMARNHSPFNKDAQIEKQQFNARLYQPLGDNGDFLSLSGHWNQNRNNFQGSVPLRTDTAAVTGSRVVGPNSSNRFPITTDERQYTVARCTTQQNRVTETPAQILAAGYVDPDGANSCGSIFDERFNPSNTGNIRGASKFTLGEGLVLSVDPSYQYVKANGGGTVVAQEGLRDVNPASGTANIGNCALTPTSATNSCQVGYIAGVPYFGRDLNGDGDALDTVRLLAPSQTQTHRIGVISSLRWDFMDGQSIRIAYTYDRARHRQTGEVGFLQGNGQPFDVFPVNAPLTDRNGRVLQKRDRLSFAILHQVSGEYRGEFMDGNLVVNAGIRAPFFRRNLTNYCATSSAAGFVECFTDDAAAQAAYLANAATQNVPGVGTFPIQGPQQRIFNYNRVLPNVGFTYTLIDNLALFANYSKGLQVPGTDNLYNSFYFPVTAAQAKPTPETSDNFDLGVRYNTSMVQVQFSGWYTNYQNRLASAYDAELDRTIYRNLGQVKKWGFDGSVGFRPIPELSLYAFGSYLKSEIQENVQVGVTTAAGPLGPIGTPIFAQTAGKAEAGAPVWNFGGGAQLDLGPVELGTRIKRTGPRYVYDTNEPVRAIVSGTTYEVYPAKTPAYTLVDLNARVNLEWAGLNDKTYFQLNVLNVFDELWVGGFSGNLNQGPTFNSVGAITNYGNAPNSQIGYPRTIMGSLVVGF
ncbi:MULTISPECIES: TonB-dependent receptor [unclassified Sphingomonas]|uniref:TonB-dependent receptor n=1 Tax=unclassified Sphingomonas TaxID=196159 RepID=UPI0008329782|nr:MULTISPECIES: TonB-dependent receptor [unclassified Sphingomonas]